MSRFFQTCFILLGLASLSAQTARAQFAEGVMVNAVQVPLNAEDPDQERVGRLTYLGGVALSSLNPCFGGLSGLAVDAKGTHFLAISDKAIWWTGRLYFRDGKLAEVDDVAYAPMNDINGLAFVGVQTDAEALTIAGDGTAHVAFERDHRIVRYNLADRNDLRTAFITPAREIPRMEALRASPLNGGIEAMVGLGRDLLLAISEKLEAPGAPGSTELQGWLIYQNTYLPVRYRPARGHNPTDMSVLPNGDVMVIERRYSPFAGVSIRLCIIPRQAIAPETLLPCEEVAKMRPPLTVDNFEGITARQNEAGETVIFLVSDDNFSSDQRTLLMMFRLEPEAP